MFEELDDPAPDLRPSQTLPSVRARGRALRRRRRLATATGAGTAIALVAALVLALPGGGTTEGLIATDPVPTSEPSAVPSRTPVPSREPTSATTAPATSGPEPTSGPAAGRVVELRGDDLAVTAVGAPRDEAVAALSAVLGAPESDPARDVGCVTAHTEVAWPQFRVAFDSAGRLSGWASTDPRLTTPSGVAVGTTVERLEQVYGDRLRLYPSDFEAGDTYTVEGVQMLGSLSGTAPADRVVALRNGDCTGP